MRCWAAVDIEDRGREVHALDGVVAVLPLSRHASASGPDDGLEVLTTSVWKRVVLKGEGFTLHVAEGQRVRTGDRLPSFNPQTVAP
jgi:phosphotransferase system IIA component